jgi:probable F420-dependent oxidoreductase
MTLPSDSETAKAGPETKSVSLSLLLTTFSPKPVHSWTQVLDAGRAADAAGIDRVVVADHVVFGENLDAYSKPELGGRTEGKQPTGSDGLWLEPLTVLAALSSITTRVRLATGILIAALRRPVVLAKMASTLDALSCGRLELGVGVGWQREEYEAAGLNFATRGRILDHTLAVCESLWGQTRSSYASADLHFENVHMFPKPVRSTGVPIWVSGSLIPIVMRRLARFGCGWIPWGEEAEDLRGSVPIMRRNVEELGRDPTEIEVVGRISVLRDEGGSVDLAKTMEAVPPLVAFGATDIRVALPLPNDTGSMTTYLSDAAGLFDDSLRRG